MSSGAISYEPYIEGSEDILEKHGRSVHPPTPSLWIEAKTESIR